MSNATNIERLNRLLTALARDVEVTEGRTLDFAQAEQMLRTIHAARTELDALALDLAADEATALAA